MTKYLLLLGLFALLFLRPTVATADARINWNMEGQSFSSEGKTAEAQVNLKDAELAILSNKKRRKLKLDLKLLQNGDFYISDDGKCIVWILKSYSAWPLNENTPVAIIFANDKEIKRVNYREAGSFKLEYTVSHTNWLESVKVDFKTSEITLKEHGLLGKKTKINWDANEINTITPPPETDVTPPSDPPNNGYKASDLAEDPAAQQKKVLAASQDYMEKMKVYSAEMLKITEWYTAETKVLATKVDDMSDADVNAASQKLAADYNRKLIKLQAQMPQWNPNALSSEQKTISPPPPQNSYRITALKKSDRIYIFNGAELSTEAVLKAKIAPDIFYRTVVFWPKEFKKEQWIAVCYQVHSLSYERTGEVVRVLLHHTNAPSDVRIDHWAEISEHELTIKESRVTGRVKAGKKWITLPDADYGREDVKLWNTEVAGAAKKVRLKYEEKD